ncbi:PREDICTED: gamma-aminobutyric acid receptor alpha-like isoform X2 [Nicrophorus vespilloides]|uniref:Gamma-aminobutyric acid receptor alpha-like isoform X2 n=1 Tax=Nicrophorus vespilloides TaxID=110193 RepID=A0ABM1M5P6_NICVS|nr:PREDICTED: gamma-aminobutyric acid receptor alpha-like isoform X2 [Nicrophorus vespilloides]
MAQTRAPLGWSVAERFESFPPECRAVFVQLLQTAKINLTEDRILISNTINLRLSGDTRTSLQRTNSMSSNIQRQSAMSIKILTLLLIIHLSCLECSIRLMKAVPVEDAAMTSTSSVVLGFSQRGNYLRVDNGNSSSRKRRSPLNDHVSRNITMVLENLLKNYESSQLPTHGQDKPTVVQTNILIRSMGPVSELDMEYSMDCYFRQYWRDRRLSFFGPIKSLSLSIKMLERIWRPDTYFYNGKNSYVHTITVPNKLLRISQDGDILYSMRLTIKAKCPMELRTFPMDRQSCPLILGSYAYTSRELVYQWQNEASVNFVPGMTLSQFDLMSFPYRNFTFRRREGDFSVLQVSFNLQRHTGYFLIQVYVPCILIVVLSWVSFWIHREATSDRVGLGITTVLTLSTISLDSRTDLPKVRYATALDWFLLMSFFYCIATLLEFAGVHYFTKVGSGEIPVDEEEWEDCDSFDEPLQIDPLQIANCNQIGGRRRNSIICPIYNDPSLHYGSRRMSICSTSPSIHQTPPPPPIRLTMERTTQTEYRLPKWRQFWYCLIGDDKFRKRRQREAAAIAAGNDHGARHVNSVSYIDRAARVLFPTSFTLLNVIYWVVYYTYQEDFKWGDPPLHTLSH